MCYPESKSHKFISFFFCQREFKFVGMFSVSVCVFVVDVFMSASCLLYLHLFAVCQIDLVSVFFYIFILNLH